MSIIVAVRKGRRLAIASDTMSCSGHHRDTEGNVDDPKILRIGSAWVGCTGWSLYSNILQDFIKPGSAPVLKDEKSIYRFMIKFWKALRERYTLVNEQCEGKDSPFGELDSSFLIVHTGGIFGVSGNMSVTRYLKYSAIGCGSDYAYGALYNIYDQHRNPGKIAEAAVRTASHFDIHCGGNVDVRELKGA